MKLLFYGWMIVLLASCNSNPLVVVNTEYGSITIELYEEQAPVTSANFLRYVDEERFKEACFYRVVTRQNQPSDSVKIEVIQGGLYDEGHPDLLPAIIHETTHQTKLKHLNGTLSMARFEPGTAQAEFFICVGDQPELDYGGQRNADGEGFAAFGRVIKGMETVLYIQQLPETNQLLNQPVQILSVSHL